MTMTFFEKIGFDRVEKWLNLNGFIQVFDSRLNYIDETEVRIEYESKSEVSISFMYYPENTSLIVYFLGKRGKFSLSFYLLETGRKEIYKEKFFKFYVNNDYYTYITNLLELFETDLKLNFNHLDDLGSLPK
jgi:hypothetical protein